MSDAIINNNMPPIDNAPSPLPPRPFETSTLTSFYYNALQQEVLSRQRRVSEPPRPLFRHIEPAAYRKPHLPPHRHVGARMYRYFDPRDTDYDTHCAGEITSQRPSHDLAEAPPPTRSERPASQKSAASSQAISLRPSNYQPPDVQTLSSGGYTAASSQGATRSQAQAGKARYSNYQPPDVRSVSGTGYNTAKAESLGYSRPGPCAPSLVGTVEPERCRSLKRRGDSRLSVHVRQDKYKVDGARTVEEEGFGGD